MVNKKTLSVTLLIDRQGRTIKVLPDARSDTDFELVRQALHRLFRPAFGDLLRRLLGANTLLK